MTTLIVSDLHSNHQALLAVLRHVQRKGWDEILCLGDFVGYGAEPNQVLDLMRTIPARKIYIRGNHDRVVAGIEDGEAFNFAARSAALWTRDRLSAANRKFIRSLVIGPVVARDGLALCHGSPSDEDEYLFSEYDALRIFRRHNHRLIFFGHTHFPTIFELDSRGEISAEIVRAPRTLKLNPRHRYLINPGSVGQPRDRNPRASFAILDGARSSVRFFRLAYDVGGAQRAILRAGLPRVLADRLSVGT